MTVQELIDRLTFVKDKSKQVRAISEIDMFIVNKVNESNEYNEVELYE